MSLTKKRWRNVANGEVYRVADISGGEIYASSPHNSWRGSREHFENAFVDASIKTRELVIAQNQIWQHIATGVRHATVSAVIESRIMLESLLDGTACWVTIEELINDFEQVEK